MAHLVPKAALGWVAFSAGEIRSVGGFLFLVGARWKRGGARRVCGAQGRAPRALAEGPATGSEGTKRGDKRKMGCNDEPAPKRFKDSQGMKRELRPRGLSSGEHHFHGFQGPPERIEPQTEYPQGNGAEKRFIPLFA